MTRRQEIIHTLLEWYEDVLNSWQDGLASEAFGYPTVNAILRHPSYRELERLLPMLRAEEPVTYWNVMQRYLYAPTKVVYRCASCGPRQDSPTYAILHPNDQPQPHWGDRDDGPTMMHRHGRKVVTLRPCRVRAPSLAIRPELVSRGIVWIDDHFAVEPFIPDFDSPKRTAAA